jgi:hypothetical protein
VDKYSLSYTTFTVNMISVSGMQSKTMKHSEAKVLIS